MIECTGSEDHLGKCTHIQYENLNCGHELDVVIECENALKKVYFDHKYIYIYK